jgi:hypothetical protein
MYIYIMYSTFWLREIAKIAGIDWGSPTGHSWDILHKAKGDHLDRVHSDKKVLEMIRASGRGGWSLLSKARSLKTS